MPIKVLTSPHTARQHSRRKAAFVLAESKYSQEMSFIVVSLAGYRTATMLNPQIFVHYSFHFIVPGLLAWLLFPERWELAWLLMIGTMVVDIDHLFARPIFDPQRCSIGFHFLHSYPAIFVYGLLLFVPNFYVQIIAVGLLFHMYTDWQDCVWTAHSKKYTAPAGK